MKPGLPPPLAAAAEAESTTPRTPEQQRLYRQCEEFEAALLAHLFASMRQALQAEGGALATSTTSENYRSLFDHEVARAVSGSAGLGVASLLYRQLAAGLPLPASAATPDNQSDSSE